MAGTIQSSGKAAGSVTQQDAESGMLVTHSLRGDGFDASEDGTGRGTPLIPIGAVCGGSDPIHTDGKTVFPLTTRHGDQTAICFSSKDYGGDAGELSPTLRAGEFASSHANAGVPPAVVIPIQEIGKRTGKSTTDPRAGLGIANEGEPMFTLQSGAQHGVATSMAVRRLTPRECERLQGFSDDYTRIPLRNKNGALNGKWAKDGPRYKSLGNSMAVPVMRWIAERIAAVDEIPS